MIVKVPVRPAVNEKLETVGDAEIDTETGVITIRLNEDLAEDIVSLCKNDMLAEVLFGVLWKRP